MTEPGKEKISSSLKKLEQIVGWFDEQEEVDVEEGLKRVKEGVALLKELKARLKKVENEFEEVKKGLEVEE
ncbi:MAG: exodeoxyribonuclease VII small subunit [Candidatus Liptonbacteria bacterium]|nr:exodeoxyribonuclease VII small subunit [Candidatus Liptonbacteria bacterium]